MVGVYRNRMPGSTCMERGRSSELQSGKGRRLRLKKLPREFRTHGLSWIRRSKHVSKDWKIRQSNIRVRFKIIQDQHIISISFEVDSQTAHHHSASPHPQEEVRCVLRC